MRKIAYTLLLPALLFCAGFVNAQNAGMDLSIASLKKDIVPHSPEAEAMAKYDVLPVNLYVGLPSISVPLYEIKTPSLSLPFALSYNYNGLRPNEVSTWAGLGWSVQGGGVITRIVKGQIDDNMPSGHTYDNFANINGMAWSQDYLSSAALGNEDTEPDLYIFRAGGYSGKFILIKGKAYLFPHQNLQITPYGTGFKIIDDKGNTYVFTDIETTYHKGTSGGINVPYHNSAWYLSTVTSADHKDVVYFNYTGYTYKQPATYIDSYTIKYNGQGGCSNTNTSCHSFVQELYDGDHINGKLLVSVTSNWGSIFFNASTATRLDRPSTSGEKILDNITIEGPAGSNLDKEYLLMHSYFGSNDRLRLDSIKIYNGSDANKQEVNRYGFDYESGNGFASNGTRAIDMFGYFNGATSNQMLFPSGVFNPALYNYANRSANIYYNKAGIMKKITYPTGGSTDLEWEQNQKGHYHVLSTYTNVTQEANNIYSQNTPSSGVTTMYKNFSIATEQDASITMFCFDGGPVPTIPIAKIYNFNTNQLVYTSPLFASGVYNGSGTVHLPVGDYYMEVKCQQAITQTDAALTYKVYDIDSTLADGPGLRIKRMVFHDNVYNPAEETLVKQYSYDEGTELLNTGVSGYNLEYFYNCTPYNCGSNANVIDATYTQTTFQASVKSALSDLADEQFYYKNVTEVNRDAQAYGKTVYTYNTQSQALLDVKLETQTDYQYRNGNFLPVRKLEAQYSDSSRISFEAYKPIKSREVGGPNSCEFCEVMRPSDATQPLTSVTSIYSAEEPYFLSSNYTLKTMEKETMYDDNGNATMQNQMNYYYDNPDHLFPTRIVSTNSKGQTVTTTMTYPLDLHPAGCTTTLTDMNWSFKTDETAAIGTVSNQFASLTSALGSYQPYYNQSSSNQSTFASIVNSYNVRGAYESASTTATNNRNSALTSYIGCLDAGIASGSVSDWEKAVLYMQKNNIVSPVLGKTIAITTGSATNVLAAVRTKYKILGTQAIEPVSVEQLESRGTIAKSSFDASADTYYTPQISYQYDAQLNLATQTKKNSQKNSYLWNYSDRYAVASVANANAVDIAYTSFEGDNAGSFTFSGQPTSAPLASVTGINDYELSNGAISKTGLTTTTRYRVTYWSQNGSYSVSGTQSGWPRQLYSIIRDGQTWNMYEHVITGVNTVTVSGTGAIDEMRLYPEAAQMTTYTYDPGIGLTAQTDVAGRISYYIYDKMGRLSLIRDQENKIARKICYSFTGEPSSCDLYSSGAISQVFTRNNCAGSGTPASITYAVPAGAYSSSISQADADSKAQADINNNGQAYANQYATCTWGNAAANSILQRNNCGTGYTGSAYNYFVAAGTFTSHISQADADAKAAADISTNAQTAANTYGTCTPTCTSSNCSGVNKKCINGVCETGTKAYIATRYLRNTGWSSTYIYYWSDCSVSDEYTEVLSSAPDVATVCGVGGH